MSKLQISNCKFQSGEGGIRTHGTVSRTQHFQCCQFSHSCTSPNRHAVGKAEGRNWSLWVPSLLSARCLPPTSLTGGEGGIRTHGTREGSTVFETARFNHSRTSPYLLNLANCVPAMQICRRSSRLVYYEACLLPARKCPSSQHATRSPAGHGGNARKHS